MNTFITYRNVDRKMYAVFNIIMLDSVPIWTSLVKDPILTMFIDLAVLALEY